MKQEEKLRKDGLIDLIKRSLCIRENMAQKFIEFKQIESINDFIKLGYKDNNKLQNDFWKSFNQLMAV